MSGVTFYTNCMNHTVSPGFVADRVHIAGTNIKGLGSVFLFGADLFTKYGWSGMCLSAIGTGIGKIIELRLGKPEVKDHFVDKLYDTARAAGIGIALALTGAGCEVIGEFLTSRETQCAIGDRMSSLEYPRA